ncbi:hypothetical protein [Sphaerospermopsis aphanizomenoides]|nr:hypothetical protein [Sphaerospermopsis aphanizomenoides]
MSSIFLAGGIISRWGLGRGRSHFLRLNYISSRKNANTQRIQKC